MNGDEKRKRGRGRLRYTEGEKKEERREKGEVGL